MLLYYNNTHFIQKINFYKQLNKINSLKINKSMSNLTIHFNYTMNNSYSLVKICTNIFKHAMSGELLLEQIST